VFPIGNNSASAIAPKSLSAVATLDSVDRCG
jgi:hypothetical protein